MTPLAVFDIDGTLFRWQLFHALATELSHTAAFSDDDRAQLAAKKIAWEGKQASWTEYERHLIDVFEQRLPDIPIPEVEKATTAVLEHSGHKIYHYTSRLLRELQKKGYHTVAISGSQHELASLFARQYGFDECIGLMYEQVGDHYTATRARPTVRRKHTLLEEYLLAHPELTLEKSIAVGDSSGDISLLELVTTPIAFNPSEELLEVATARGWKIVVERKNIAYTLENRDGSFVLAHTNSF